MRVLYILDPATRGGATESFLSLIRHIKKHGISPIVCTSNDDHLNNMLDELGIRNFAIHHYEMITSQDSGHGLQTLKRNTRKLLKYIKHDIQAIRTIRKHVDMEAIDIIHTNSSRSDVGFWLSMLYHKPHIVHLREFGDMDYEVYPLNPCWKHVYNRFSSRFICVSKAVQEHWISKGIRREKTCVVYNGINYERVLSSSDDSKYEIPLKMVIVGVVTISKGQYLAINAMRELSAEIKPNVTLDIIGSYWDRYKEQIEEAALKNGVQGQIRFLGQCDDVLQRIADYHIGLMCSRAEGFGRVTAEYMFARLGIIASNTGANPELITSGEEGLLFHYEDEVSLARAIEYYYANRDVLIKHSNAARLKAEKMFKAEMYADNVYNVYQQTVTIE